MPRFSEHVTTVADIMATTAKNGEVRCNIGDQLTGVGFGAETAMWGVDGFVSRPNDPDAAGVAMCITITDGDTKRIIATRDNRWAAKAGNLAPGDRAIVSNCDARFFLKKATNSLTMYTANKTGNDEPIVLDLNGSKGDVTILVGGPDGTAVIHAKSGEIKLAVDGGGAMLLDKDGVSFYGPQFAVNCGKGYFGMVGTGAPPPGPNSILMGVSGMAGIPSPNWTMF